ncbi:helix-turn-helix domain-containing protein [Robinsoniella sp. KNHs210]|uniref:helix-turn-helix domain-containing protein n=1 Tax=Robinsoniella sp. KNHs210 TaxID=1469950 RepID=UPI000488AE77|nr:helix-turn-helix domain-containing protein [Robinsoniella sp. KNHs210]
MNANERVKYLRTTLNINQEQLGKAIGISKSGISAIENGTRNVTEKHIKLIANAYNINEEWLRNGTGEMFEQLTEQEKVMKYTAYLLKDTESSIAESIKNLIVTYQQLDDTSKEVLEKIIDTYVEKIKKDQS